MLKVINVSGGYGEQFLLKQINFQVAQGEFFGIIGPNGSGKTTLVKMISGLLQATEGEVFVHGKNITEYRPKQLAKKLAVLPQLTEQSFRFTVRETVSLGRYAHQTGLFQTLTKNDEQIIDRVLEQTDIKRYEHVLLDELSGGERQRVFLAQALAQEPEIIVLDEPTNHLDLAYQKDLLDLLKQWTLEKKLTVISIFHDLNIASLYCDRLLLMHNGKVSVSGEPQDVLKNGNIYDVYGTKVEHRFHPEVPKPQVMLIPKRLENGKHVKINEQLLTKNESYLKVVSPIRLKTMGTNLDGNFGWYDVFVQQFIRVQNESSVAEGFLSANHVLSSFIGERFSATTLELAGDGFSLFIVATAGEAHRLANENLQSAQMCTVKLWVFINGMLTDQAFVQALMTITEAKTAARMEAEILLNGQIKQTEPALFSNADEIVIASTQSGAHFSEANRSAELGQLLREGTYQCVQKVMNRLKVEN